MRVLLDSCVWGPARFDLEAAGHETDWVGLWGNDPGDEQILEHALRHGLVVVTLDKDFGELAVVTGLRHRGIVRIVGFSARQHGAICARVLARYSAELERGGLVTVEPGRIRIRPAE